MTRLAALALLLALAASAQYKDLFNGKDFSGWVNLNTAPDTWKFENGMLVCSGHPTGVLRSERQYENFVLHVEWMHTEPGGNSGMFLWSGPRANPGSPFPDAVEVQMLELDWPNLHKQDGKPAPLAY